MQLRLIDIFAGPGGLSEGFTAVRNQSGEPVFDHRLAIEMEPWAFETLKLRTFFRACSSDIPTNYYRCLRREISIEDLYGAHPAITEEVAEICWNARLGPGGETTKTVRDRIRNAIGSSENWVLIGGPPCQAYSLAGRSRNKGNPEYDPNKDVRQTLYVEYLQILADHSPAAFVMENVKGLLSATLNNERIFHRIIEDLQNPAKAVRREGRDLSTKHRSCGYRIFSLTNKGMLANGDLFDSIVQCEHHGIPQTRHRVILLGLREDITITPDTLATSAEIPVARVIADMPPVRSGISRGPDSDEAWIACFRNEIGSRWANGGTRRWAGEELCSQIGRVLKSISPPEQGCGAEFVPGDAAPEYAADWYRDPRIGGFCNHCSRTHMKRDLHRYLYAACFAQSNGKSPILRDFPTDLLPKHGNVNTALEEGSNFSDRFRVQVAERPATTITSHIAKDGHYYIHPDPMQCRSLTVREAARIQTFPDNYFFCGPRTAQYTQVGNAVPPLIARQVAQIVFNALRSAGMEA